MFREVRIIVQLRNFQTVKLKQLILQPTGAKITQPPELLCPDRLYAGHGLHGGNDRAKPDGLAKALPVGVEKPRRAVGCHTGPQNAQDRPPHIRPEMARQHTDAEFDFKWHKNRRINVKVIATSRNRSR